MEVRFNYRIRYQLWFCVVGAYTCFVVTCLMALAKKHGGSVIFVSFSSLNLVVSDYEMSIGQQNFSLILGISFL